MIPNQFRWFFNIFDTFGYNSGWSKLSKFHKNLVSIYVVHILLAFVLFIYEFRLFTIYFKRLPLSEGISECLQYTAALYTYSMIIFDSLYHRQTHKQFWNILKRIDRDLYSQGNLKQQTYLIKFSLFLIKNLICIVFRIGVQSYAGVSIDTPYVFLFIICEIRMFYYLFCLDMIYFQLKIIEMECMNIEMSSHQHEIGCVQKTLRIKGYQTIFSFSYELQRMKWIRDYVFTVYEMTRYLNKIFGWSNVAAISFGFCFLLTETHWCYVNRTNLNVIYQYSKYFIDFVIVCHV